MYDEKCSDMTQMVWSGHEEVVKEYVNRYCAGKNRNTEKPREGPWPIDWLSTDNPAPSMFDWRLIHC